jgi:8-oxo-dGTP pyrophosphatase MutT (NUDIX family)
LNQIVLAELAAIHPLDDTERQHLADAIAWVESGAPLCRIAKPATPPKHLVSYFAVVDGENILLVDHRNAGLWLPTGGHVEADEHPRQTVIRELFEELGLAAEAGAIDAPVMLTVTETVGLTAGHVDVSLWYVVPGDRTHALRFDAEEFDSVRWFGFDEVPLQRADPHLGRFIAKLRAAARS